MQACSLAHSFSAPFMLNLELEREQQALCRASKSMAALLARQGDAPQMGPVSSIVDFILHTLLRLGRARLAGAAHLLADPPAPPEALPWSAPAMANVEEDVQQPQVEATAGPAGSQQQAAAQSSNRAATGGSGDSALTDGEHAAGTPDSEQTTVDSSQ